MKVAIAGYGVEGEASYNYWSRLGHDVTIVDEAATTGRPVPVGAQFIQGTDAFADLYGFDLVVRTASLPPHRIVTDGQVWSSTNEFFAKCPAPIIGVTGTKGKGTTCSLIANILREAGHDVHLLGNIGTPALEVLPKIKPDDIVVFEMSSFQLWDLERSPHVAVVLMIEPDHLDIHADFDDYIKAKSHIRIHQMSEDVCFYHSTNRYSKQIALSGVLGDTARYGIEKDGAVYVKENNFCVQSEIICPIDSLSIAGRYNLENACAAISAARVFTVDERAIERGIRGFSGLPHRLKLVAEINEVKYYDDSIATTPGSALAVLAAFDEPKVIILGGHDKGADYAEVVEKCKETDTTVVAIGTTGQTIARLCHARGVTVQHGGETMAQIVATAAKHAKKGGVVLLCPASASFGLFKNYADRGDQFVAAVKKMQPKVNT